MPIQEFQAEDPPRTCCLNAIVVNQTRRLFLESSLVLALPGSALFNISVLFNATVATKHTMFTVKKQVLNFGEIHVSSQQ